MEVLIIRHAQSLHNVNLCDNLDSELSKIGVEQVSATAKWLKENHDLTDYQGLVSPYFRTLQTACVISKETGLEFTVHGGVREYHIEKTCELNEAGGIVLPKRADQFQDCKIHWPDMHWRTGKVMFRNEDVEEFIERIQLFINTLERHGKYVIVGHGASCRTLHALLTGGDLSEVRRRYTDNSFDFAAVDGHPTSVRNCSLTLVRNGESVWFSKVVYDEKLSRVAAAREYCK